MRVVAIILVALGLASFARPSTAPFGILLIVGGSVLYSAGNRAAGGRGENGFIVAILAAGALGALATIVHGLIQRL